MQKAIVAIEDSRYYEHGAVDLKGVLRALNKNAQSGGVSQGASTLTQQLVKNVFVEEAGDDPTKVAQATQQTHGPQDQELKYAIQLEEELGKKKILENYLNITFFGEQAYGVEAASQRYFSKHAKDLTLPQAALLAGIVQSPEPLRPGQQRRRRPRAAQHRARRAWPQVEDISQAEADTAKKTPLGLQGQPPEERLHHGRQGRRLLLRLRARGLPRTTRPSARPRRTAPRSGTSGGLTIRTTLDPKAQESVQASIKEHVYKSDNVATAATIVEPGTGKILAMGQSRPYGFGKNETQINLSVDQAMGGGARLPARFDVQADHGRGRPRGRHKPRRRRYSVAVRDGRTRARSRRATARRGSTPTAPRSTNENESEVGPVRHEGGDRQVGQHLLRAADRRHRHLPGHRRWPRRWAWRAPTASKITQVPVHRPRHPGDVAADDGERVRHLRLPRHVLHARSPSSRSPRARRRARSHSRCRRRTARRAMSEKTADTINTLLKGVVEDGTGTQAGLGDRASAGKTGTTDDRYAAWFVGYTPNMAGAVWVGDPAHKRSRWTNITIGGSLARQGRTAARSPARSGGTR